MERRLACQRHAQPPRRMAQLAVEMIARSVGRSNSARWSAPDAAARSTSRRPASLRAMAMLTPGASRWIALPFSITQPSGQAISASSPIASGRSCSGTTGPGHVGVVPDRVVAEIELLPVLGLDMGRPRPAMAAPVKDAQCLGRHTLVGGDFVGVVKCRHPPQKIERQKGIRFSTRPSKCARLRVARDVAGLGDDGKAQALVASSAWTGKGRSRTVTRLCAFAHLIGVRLIFASVSSGWLLEAITCSTASTSPLASR